jgi:hypothetical protein
LTESTDTIRDRLVLPAVGVAVAGTVACVQVLFVMLWASVDPLAAAQPRLAPWTVFASWGPLPGIVMLAGAVSMLWLRFYWLAVAGCVLAVLPVSFGCVIGLPAGLWGLGRLLQPEVRDAFRRRAETRAAAYQAQMRRLDQEIDADLREPPGSPWSGPQTPGE